MELICGTDGISLPFMCVESISSTWKENSGIGQNILNPLWWRVTITGDDYLRRNSKNTLRDYFGFN